MPTRGGTRTAKVRTPKGVPAPSRNGQQSAVARKRRDQIVTAATAIIAREGIHKFSLARIEQKVRMSRGQLTYYFRTKESILLAVFDRMLERMLAAALAEGMKAGLGGPGEGRVMERVRFALDKLMDTGGADTADLRVLAHAFHAQVRHRPDFKAKLAEVNTGWRAHVAADVAACGVAHPAAVASVIMALFMGLTEQLTVDPDAFDRAAVAAVCVRLLGTLFEEPS